MDRPRVIIHAAVSLDGRTDGFPADDAMLRRLGATWPAARVLAGRDPLASELLAQGLVDEVSLLVHPFIAGEGHASWAGGERLPPGIRLVRKSVERVERGLAWLRFEVTDGKGR
jgi:riboflavin biosynthesis pyrimidine reductase